MRNFRKELLECVCNCVAGRGKKSVDVKANNTKFRCKPGVSGSMILYKGLSRKQYTNLSFEEFII